MCLPDLYIAQSLVDLGVDKEQSLADFPVGLLPMLQGMVWCCLGRLGEGDYLERGRRAELV